MYCVHVDHVHLFLPIWCNLPLDFEQTLLPLVLAFWISGGVPKTIHKERQIPEDKIPYTDKQQLTMMLMKEHHCCQMIDHKASHMIVHITHHMKTNHHKCLLYKSEMARRNIRPYSGPWLEHMDQLFFRHMHSDYFVMCYCLLDLFFKGESLTSPTW